MFPMREVERYTSPSRFEAEKRVVFRRLPQIVGRASELAEPGCFFTHDAAGTALLLTRDDSGVVHAMLNECRHRGARLVLTEEGSAPSFVCKYHSWRYDLRGQLARPGRVSLPAALEQFMDDSALVDFPCETRHGFLWVLPTARAELDVARWLGELDVALGDAGLADHRVVRRTTERRASNWKLVLEDYLEGGGAASSRPRRLIFPRSLLSFEAGFVVHTAVFPDGLEQSLLVHTMLMPAGADHPPSQPPRPGAPGAPGASPPLPGALLPPPAFHEALERAMAAHPRARERE